MTDENIKDMQLGTAFDAWAAVSDMVILMIRHNFH
jgi:hypothetical protein